MKKSFRFLALMLALIMSVTMVGCFNYIGSPGESAYQIAVRNGFVGTEVEWLESLRGQNGTNAQDGKSAYQIAVENGFEGTEEAWLDSLKGQDGEVAHKGESAYEIAVKNGFEGTEEEWLASLNGEVAHKGESAYEIAVKNGFVGTEEEWLESLKGEKGEDATDGKSAYEIAVENGFVGTEEAWLESLKGADGLDVYEVWYSSLVENGYEGSYADFLEEYIKGNGLANDTIERATNKALLSTVEIFVPHERIMFGQVTTSYSAGAGVVIDDDKSMGDAYIVTNYHVIYDANSETTLAPYCYVYFYGMSKISPDGATTNKEMFEYSAIQAVPIGGSLTEDIAVLQITNCDIYKNGDYCPATIGRGDDVIVGETAIAVGNPSGGGISATMGVVSVVTEIIDLLGGDDKTEIQPRVIRVDTPINGGNSGGGLFNKNCELIGIVNAKTVSNDIDNMGYAIPSEVAIGIANNIIARHNSANTATDEIEANGYGINKCTLGVVVRRNNSYAVYNEETGKTEIVIDISVSEVVETGAAYGYLQVGDKLKSATLNGITRKVTTIYVVGDLLFNAKQNDILTLVVDRYNGQEYVQVTVEIPLVNVSYVK